VHDLLVNTKSYNSTFILHLLNKTDRSDNQEHPFSSPGPPYISRNRTSSQRHTNPIPGSIQAYIDYQATNTSLTTFRPK
jgi:hypothetical protein